MQCREDAFSRFSCASGGTWKMGESRIVDHDVRPGFRRSCVCGCKRPSEALFFFLIQQAAWKRQLSSRTRHQKGANDGQQKHATEALKMFQEPSLLGLKIPITKKGSAQIRSPDNPAEHRNGRPTDTTNLPGYHCESRTRSERSLAKHKYEIPGNTTARRCLVPCPEKK